MIKYNVNDTISVEKDLLKDKVIISICENDVRNTILELDVQDYYKFRVKSNENYIAMYFKQGVMSSEPIDIKAIYDIKKHAIVDISDESIRSIFENMLVPKRPFETGVVISYINMRDIGIASKREMIDFENYITFGNENISQDDVIEYIFKTYPSLEKFKDINCQVSSTDYRQMIEEVGSSVLKFNIMPQVFDLALAQKKDDNDDNYQYSRKRP